MKLLSRYDLGLFLLRLRQTTSDGASVASALERIAIVEADDALRLFLQNASAELGNGASIGEALFPTTGHPFPAFLQQILASVDNHEKSLGKALDLATSYLSLKASRDTRAELIVNSLTVLGSILFFIFVAVVVIPPFMEMYADFGGQLPAPTRIVMGISQLIRDYWIIDLIALGGLCCYIYWFEKRRILDADLALVFDHLATKIERGLPIVEALGSSAKIVSKKELQVRLQAATHGLANGSTFIEVLKEAGLLDLFAAQLLNIEQQNTENLANGLFSISGYHTSLAQAKVHKQNVYITVNLILCLVVIIITIIAMYLPIFKLAGAVGG